MYRANLNLVLMVLVVLILSSLAVGADNLPGGAGASVISSPVELKTPKGFNLQGQTLTLPNGKTLENVTGLQELGKTVLIVSQSEVGIYGMGNRRYSVLTLPRPPVAVVGHELMLIPFDEAASSDKTVGKRTAFITFKGAEKSGIGVYRYRVGQPTLELDYLPACGRVPGQFQSWHTFKSDMKGAKPFNIRIDMDRSEKPEPGCRYGYYSPQIFRGQQEGLKCIGLPSPEQTARRREAAIAQMKELEAKRFPKKAAAPVPTPGEPE